jgi:oligogalacturonide lyase
LVSSFAGFLSICSVLSLLLTTSFASELRNDWVDPDTGHRVVRLSRVPGDSQSLYFHNNEFTASGDKLVYENGGSDKTRTQRGFWTNRIYVYDFNNQKSELLTDNGGKVILVEPNSRKVYHQRSNTLFATHLDTRETKTLAQLPLRWRISAINSDETLGAGTFVEGGPQIDTSGPKSSWFDKVFEAGRPGGIFLVNLKTGETNVIKRGTNWFNHLQFSPVDPALLQFCHEGPWHKLDRIWQIRTDGTSLRLMHPRTMPMEIAGHEFWSHDGQRVWFDLQMPRGEKFFLAGVPVVAGQADTRPGSSAVRKTETIDGARLSPAAAGRKSQTPSEISSVSLQSDVAAAGDSRASTATTEIRYELPRDQWSVHYNISWDGKLFAGDGGDERMVAHAQNGKWIYLFTPQPDKTLKAEKLVNMSKHDYDLEPNVQFKPDGKWIVFRANFDGATQVYAVEVAKTSSGKIQASTNADPKAE